MTSLLPLLINLLTALSGVTQTLGSFDGKSAVRSYEEDMALRRYVETLVRTELDRHGYYDQRSSRYDSRYSYDTIAPMIAFLLEQSHKYNGDFSEMLRDSQFTNRHDSFSREGYSFYKPSYQANYQQSSRSFDTRQPKSFRETDMVIQMNPSTDRIIEQLDRLRKRY